MRFEKWQALGNDYIVIEERDLPFPLTPRRVERICAPHTGVGSDGILLLSQTQERGFVAELRIFNPDGSEAELSGNGAREAVMYLRTRGWTDSDSFSIKTVAGEMRPRITGRATCTMDMGRAKLSSEKDFPQGGPAGEFDLTILGREFQCQFVSIGNPQVAIEIAEREMLDELKLGVLGPEIERCDLFPNRTNVSFWTRAGENAIRARIFERGVGETMASGTGAIGAAVAAVLRGVESPVTVALDGGELEVEVEEDMHVNLTGWAVPVYAGTLSDEFVEDLRENE